MDSCDRCGAQHGSDTCSTYPRPREREDQLEWLRQRLGSTRVDVLDDARFFHIARMPGDNSCFFHCMAFLFPGMFRNALDARIVLTNFIAQNTFTPLDLVLGPIAFRSITSLVSNVAGVSLPAYLADMRRRNAWGDVPFVPRSRRISASRA